MANKRTPAYRMDQLRGFSMLVSDPNIEASNNADPTAWYPVERDHVVGAGFPLVKGPGDVPINPFEGQIVYVTGGWAGNPPSSTNDGLYIWWAADPGGAKWMKIDWSVPSDPPSQIVWIEVPVTATAFDIEQNGGGAIQPGEAPFYNLPSGSGGATYTGTVIDSGWQNGYRFGVINNRSNRDCIIDFPDQGDYTLGANRQAIWQYNGSTFDLEDEAPAPSVVI